MGWITISPSNSGSLPNQAKKDLKSFITLENLNSDGVDMPATGNKYVTIFLWIFEWAGLCLELK